MTQAWVTGGNRGIGKAVVKALCASHDKILLTYRTGAEEAAQVVAEVEAMGQHAEAVCLDVALGAATEEQVTEMVNEHGCPDSVVLNAGGPNDGLFPMMGRSRWEDTLELNLGSFYSILRPITRAMIKKRQGRIVTMSSVVGQRGNAGQVNYAAAKAGVIGATKALAQELGARNILVNCVAPGFIETRQTADIDASAVVGNIPLKRAGRPEEVAAVVEFLCSPKNTYVTGQVWSVNGGLYS